MLYDRLFDLFWKPFGLVARVLLSFRFVQSRFAPWILGASVGSWPERVTEIDPDDLVDLPAETRELNLRKARAVTPEN